MANTFEIYFFGLICHVGNDATTKLHAALPRTSKQHPHYPRVYDKDNETFLDIEDRHNVTFTFDGIFDSGAVATLGSFGRYVPALLTAVTPSYGIKGGVLAAADFASVTAYILYPEGGNLYVSDLYPKGGIYKYNTEIRRHDCTARLTVLQYTTNASVARLYYSSTGFLDIPTDSWALITNIEDQNTGKGHFAEYKKLTGSPTFVDKVDEDPNLTCTAEPFGIHWNKVRDAIAPLQAANDIECSNSQWP